MITDPISNYLTSIRNALQVKHRFVEVPSSKIKKNITQILQEQGYIHDYQEKESEISGKKTLKIKLKYTAGKRDSVIKTIKRVSKPSLRKYVASDQIPHVLNGFGISIISTSKGLMTDKKARKEKMGGEIICEIS